MKFTLQVEAEGDDLISASTSDRSKWKVISGNPVRERFDKTQTGSVVMGGKTYQQTTTSTVP